VEWQSANAQLCNACEGVEWQSANAQLGMGISFLFHVQHAPKEITPSSSQSNQSRGRHADCISGV
jgi:hypothetical protein